MSKRKMYWSCAVTVLFLAGALTALGAAAKHEPSFYRLGQLPANEGRKELAQLFVTNFGQMLANRKQETWGCVVTEAEINSFFEEIFDRMGDTEGLRKLGISAPNVTLDDNRVRLAFRYGSGALSTVISYDLEIWLVPKELNVIAVKFLSARAGALPISNRSILQQLSEFAQKQNYRVSLYRHEGHTVAIVDLRSDPQHSASIMTALKVEGHRLFIQGRTLENALPPLDPTRDLKKAAAK
ncbi:MAG: hypothetical protein EXR98_23230 [Gemmataceae bacterium]|nr:hypothetical protein [Gemmataceae bacterium]